MGNLTNKQKRSLAQVLFCKENLTIQETAERVGVSRQTVGKWAKEDKWEEQKVGVTRWGPLDEGHTVVRLVTSWATPPEAVSELLSLL